MLYIMKKHIYVFMFFLHSITYAQKQDNIWIVGGYSGEVPNKPEFGISIFDFSSKDSIKKTSPTDKGRLRFDKTCSSICDKTGNLAFYTNGVKIENWNFDTIPTKGQLAKQYNNNTPGTIVQGALILPFPEKDSLYLLLYENPKVNPANQDLSAEIFSATIDMSRNNGKGEVIELGKLIPKVIAEYYPCYGKLCAIRQPNGVDWWIYVMEYGSNTFYRYALTKDKFTYLDKQVYGTAVVNGVGAASFSLDGKYHARYNNRGIEGQSLDVYNFDRCSGQFSNQRSLKYINEYGAGVTFSPNSRFLYITIGEKILQYDMEASDFKASEKVVAKYDGFISCNSSLTNFYNCQLAPDGKIYVCTSSCTRQLHVIEKPDLPGLLCDVRQHSIDLPTYTNSSLPNFPNFRLGKAECKIGIEEVAKSEIAIYPNPVQEELFINLGSDILKLNVLLNVISATGNVVLSDILVNDHNTLNISDLSNGIYYCQFKSNNKMLTTKRLVIIK